MNTSTAQSTTGRPSPFETYGVLGAILAQAATIPEWEGSSTLTDTLLRFAGTFQTVDPSIELTLRGEGISETLASRLGLTVVRRSSRRPKSAYPGDDTRELYCSAIWEDSYAGHYVRISAYWTTPLGDLDLAEGEKLA